MGNPACWLEARADKTRCLAQGCHSGLKKANGYNVVMLKLRAATRADVDVVLELIHALAEYEREPNAVVATREDILRDGFGDSPKFWVILAEWDGVPAGFAFYFFNYSTWLGKPGLFLEDLFVKPELRGKGIGKALLAELARIAKAENCYGVKWEVLDWNQPAIDFYEKLGAKIRKEWLTVVLRGEALERLANGAK
jgi:GNAT superfamily N-acetyltransferase